jgi:pimeloyl-ACP methyl ester carboxylesterase
MILNLFRTIETLGAFMKSHLVSAIFSLAAALPTVPAFAAAKPTIVLVHGAFQDGQSTWSKVRPALEEKGYKVVVVTLPGRDGDGADPHTLTLEIYRDTVLKAIQAETNPVVLVGHSFGGITITNVAEAAPDKIKALVYLSAYLPQNGESLQSLSKQDPESGLAKPGNLIFPPDYSTATIADSAKADVFANDAQGADRDAIVASLIPEPAGPQAVGVKITDANFGRVRKFYIETLQDHAVTPSLQTQMISHASIVKVTKIDAGHASYITKPKEVAAAIEYAASH